MSSSKSNFKTLQERLHIVRHLMKKWSVEAILIRSTDRYNNEYVPEDSSARVYVTGFNGSLGDALITQEKAFLFVDGRYALQAKEQALHFEVQVQPLGQSIESGWQQVIENLTKAKELSGSIGIDAETISCSLFEQVNQKLLSLGLSLKALPMAFFDALLEEKQHQTITAQIWPVASSLTGMTVAERLKKVREFLASAKADALCLTALDDIAWLSNCRGNAFDYQATFAARCFVLPDCVLIGTQTQIQQGNSEPQIKWLPEDQILETLKSHLNKSTAKVVADKRDVSQALKQQLQSSNIHLSFGVNPVTAWKASKTKAELLHMRSGFARADRVVLKTQQWACEQVCAGKKITEADIDNFVREEYKRSGAKGLSFKPICGANEHGAIIHFGTPDNTTALTMGTLFLLDSGGLYEGGYATDLTRTFLIGDEKTVATDKQKHVFTTVLKGAIAGMSARFPKGTTGAQLDAITRNPIWRAGFQFNHGTGHGVGINVHEAPPRISPAGNMSIEIGHVFSIEPGIYLENWGGVRIENVCTLVDDPTQSEYACVLPLTFCPLDSRLIDRNKLTHEEEAFLEWYQACSHLGDHEMPSLPPR